MGKNKAVKKYEEELEEDYDLDMDLSEADFHDHSHDEFVSEMMDSMMQSMQHHQMIAMELTKLIVEKASVESLTEEKIFSIFQRAVKVASDSSMMKDLFEKLNS